MGGRGEKFFARTVVIRNCKGGRSATPTQNQGEDDMKKLWGGRFKGDLDDSAKVFSYSINVDGALLPYDIQNNIAHVKTLRKAKVLTSDEEKKLIAGLKWTGEHLAKEDLRPMQLEVEDIHTLIQMTLEKKVGTLAKKLHTARSRNDQVTTSTKLYLKDKLNEALNLLDAYQKGLLTLAKKGKDIVVPGYTHLQRAQTVLFSHHILAYLEMAERDKGRLRDALKRMDEMPLGSGAMAGLAFDLDREFTAKELGFSSICANSMDAVSSRDYIAEILSVIAIMFMHFSRLSEDMILWSSQEFKFIEISEGFATGSSIMPHKKNADMFELTRGKAGKAYGNLISLLTMMKGLPLTYNRDMQEDKEPLFSSIELLLSALQVLSKMVAKISVCKEVCKTASGDSFLYATDLMDYVVKKGVPLKDAHSLVGEIVVYALDNKKALNALSLKELKQFSSKIEKDALDIFAAEASIKKRKTFGSTNPAMVKKMLDKWAKKIK